MKRNLLKDLVAASYTKDKLNEERVMDIAAHLDRKELKAYIRALRLEEKKHKIYIALPSLSGYNTSKKTLASMYPDKELVIEEDPNLLLGVRIQDNDMVYEMSLQNRLDSIIDEIEQNYNE
ncbi:MAG TPA: hypothetical protein VFQ63_03635 [Patescibacteria group bacterium]|nr:hypothetical protein [Patescibacteria group bacterium]